MRCEICGIRDAVTSYIEEKNGYKKMIQICDECYQIQENKEELRCDVCQMSYREFLKTGVFGCENCYRVFKKQTVKILENQILKDRNKEANNVKCKCEKSLTKDKKKELLRELKELLAIAKQENDEEKVKKIEKEIKKLTEIEKEKI